MRAYSYLQVLCLSFAVLLHSCRTSSKKSGVESQRSEPAPAEEESLGKPAKEGGKCGGFGGFECEKGLKCSFAKADPDGMGICVKDKTRPPAGLGEACMMPGGPECQEGLECARRNDPFRGVCVKPAPKPGELGGECGGFGGFTCKPGLKCRESGFGGMGICVENAIAPGAAGSSCGGTSNGKCKSPLICFTNPSKKDESGVCVTETKPVLRNMSCGGFAGDCPDGYSCGPANPREPFGPRRCVPDGPIVGFGKLCGGPNRVACEGDLKCVTDTTASDRRGLCLPETSSLSELCGGPWEQKCLDDYKCATPSGSSMGACRN